MKVATRQGRIVIRGNGLEGSTVAYVIGTDGAEHEIACQSVVVTLAVGEPCAKAVLTVSMPAVELHSPDVAEIAGGFPNHLRKADVG